MQRFMVGFGWLCVAGLTSGVSAIIGSELLGWFALALGVVATANIMIALPKMFSGEQ